MATIICPSCQHKLTEYTRFCPQCGARLPEPAEPPAEQAPPAPPAVPPTVRLDAPVAPTVVLPPVGAPPPADTPTARLDEPAAGPPPADTPTLIGGAAPAAPLPPIAPPPAAGQDPAYGGGLPAGAPYAGDQQPAGGASGGRKTLMWALAGGAGCLGLVLVAICAIGVLTLLGERVEPVFEPTAVAGPVGGGGIVPDNSPLTGGDVLFEDNFDDPDASGLGEDEDESSRYAYEGGAYVIEVKEPETIVWARVDGEFDAMRAAVDMEVPPEADISSAGLIFHYQDADNFYLFSITSDGFYTLELLENNDWIVLIDSTQSDAIDATRNTIRVETSGDRIGLYVNDELLEETSDGTFTGGAVALAVTSLADSTAEVAFDNLVIERNE